MVGLDIFYRVPKKRFSPLKFHRHEIVENLKEVVIEGTGKKLLIRQDNLSLLRRKKAWLTRKKLKKSWNKNLNCVSNIIYFVFSNFYYSILTICEPYNFKLGLTVYKISLFFQDSAGQITKKFKVYYFITKFTIQQHCVKKQDIKKQSKFYLIQIHNLKSEIIGFCPETLSPEFALKQVFDWNLFVVT